MEIENIAVSQDSFHRGAFEVFQPRDGRHRSGSDALLLAAALPEKASGKLADLGAGAGVAAMAALAMNPNLQSVMVDSDPAMVAMAKRSIALSANRNLAMRAAVLQADVTLSGQKREKAGLTNDSFDHVIVNPPYNSAAQRPSSDPARAFAHIMGEGGLEAWMRTASAILRFNGMLHMIYRTENLGEIIASAQGRFGAIAILPLHARIGAPAGRIIIRAVRGSRAPLTIHPGIVLHNEDNSPTELANKALNGKTRLFAQANSGQAPSA
jgi:tRNA1(Val) A37 N6-methylase TrmN6